MSARVVFDGLDELKRTLRTLPADLRDGATGIVRAHVDGAEQEIRANYRRHHRTGALENGLRREDWRAGPWGIGFVLRNVAKHAWILEHGTKARHYVTRRGVRHAVGAGPAIKAFIPPVLRWRRAMYDALAAYVRGKGFEVSGRAA